MGAERGGTEETVFPDGPPITGVVLAGGRSRRLGRDKAVELVGGASLVSRVISVVDKITSELVVVVADDAQANALPLPDRARVVRDVYPDAGSLGGIFSGIDAADNDWTLVVACDMPFLSRPLLSHMARARDGFDIVIPVLDGRPEPTHALYSKKCLPPMEESIRTGRLKITGFFDSVAVKYVSQETVEGIDPDRWSFFNVNTEEQLETARARAAEMFSQTSQ